MDELTQIRSRFEELLWTGNLSENSTRLQKDMPPAEELLASLQPGDVDGTLCWGDIDYADQTRSGWQAQKHYVRLLQILKENGRERLVQDTVYAETLRAVLRYWLVHDFTNPNWWHNDIGMPRNLSDLGLMMGDVLSPEEKEGVTKLVGRGSMATRDDIAEKWTGANLIWGAMNTIKHALLLGDEALLRRGVDRAAQELCVGEEGIQEDGSFFQHGPRLYSGGYGRSFAYDIAQLIYVLQNTSYQFSQEKLSVYLTHILDGLRHMTQGCGLDYACIGRELARPDAVRVGLVKAAVELLVQAEDLPRQDELRDYLAEMNGEKTFEGTKYFPRAALLCHHTGGLYIGAKFHNNHIWDAEICNGEGELCYNMSYGTHTCVMREGTEYLDIDPVWNFARIPGTTSRTETDDQLLAHRDWWCLPLPNGHSGGAQKQDRAVIYEIAEHDGVETFATDFAIPGGFVCLGAGVRTIGGHEEPLVTTVEQCLLQGEVRRDGDAIIHNGVRYTPLGDTRFECVSGPMTGSWQRNNFAESDAPVTRDVLTITIAHPSGKLDGYAYVISPEDTVPSVEILSNDCVLQAIRTQDGRMMAAFHQACRLVFKDRMVSGEVGAYIE